MGAGPAQRPGRRLSELSPRGPGRYRGPAPRIAKDRAANRPELENVGAWSLIGVARGVLAWALAIRAWFATAPLEEHWARVLPAQCMALLAVVCGHKARAAIRRGKEPPGGGGLAAAALWLGYPVLLSLLSALGFVVFFLCCGVVG